jgi:multiple sugar transport system permease protein
MEASVVDGANYRQTLMHIKLPYIASVLGLTAILRMIDSFRSLVVIYNMTGGGPGVSTEVLSLHMYKTAFTSQRLGLASAISVLLLGIIVLFASILIIRSIRKEGR